MDSKGVADMLVSIDVDRTISPNDEMLAGNEKHYFGVGLDAIGIIERALISAKKEPGDLETILDFPCGHGRVLRCLSAAFPKAKITGCDLNRDGVDFCAARFGSIPVYSSLDPTQIDLPRDHFDLIWVGSLFTHFDAPRWAPFLTWFRSLLRPGGLLLFSTQGRRGHELITRYGLDDQQCAEIIGEYESSGFGYVDYRNVQDYGLAISEPAWVCRLITSLPEFRLVGFSEKVWDDHHDVFACVRDTGWKAPCTRAPVMPGRLSGSIPSNAKPKTLVERVFRWRRSA